MSDLAEGPDPYEGPDLVYGDWMSSGFVVVGEEFAKCVAKEVSDIVEAANWAEAKRASDATTVVPGPLEDELEDLGLDPDGPVETESIPGWGDGDWPPMAVTYTEDFLPEDWNLGEVWETRLNGDGVFVPEEEETKLLDQARLAGAKIRRDDGLIAAMSCR